MAVRNDDLPGGSFGSCPEAGNLTREAVYSDPTLGRRIEAMASQKASRPPDWICKRLGNPDHVEMRYLTRSAFIGVIGSQTMTPIIWGLHNLQMPLWNPLKL